METLQFSSAKEKEWPLKFKYVHVLELNHGGGSYIIVDDIFIIGVFRNIERWQNDVTNSSG